MDSGISLLIIARDFAVYDLVKRASLPDDIKLVYCHPDEDFLSLVRKRSVTMALLDAPEGISEAGPLLKKLKRFDPLIDVIVMGRRLRSEDTLEWIRQGATDYIALPLQRDVIPGVLERILEKRTLRKETFQLERTLEKKYLFQDIISRNPSMLEIFALIENISKHFTSVLITGETGTGKEMVARAIHGLSACKNTPLVICDCASIPENLFESELFGYKRGAFTGADKDKRGLFEEADKGIIFLDEIAEVPIVVQAKLLRVLENHQFRPLGSNDNKTIDVRVIAATNRDLDKGILNSSFREDLYHRLNKIEIHLPPLRERLEDIPLLVRHFVESHGSRISKNLKGVSRDVQKIFLKYDWPGNVRELENVLESASLLCKKEFIDVSNLPKQLRALESGESRLPFIRKERLSSLRDLEKDYIVYLLKFTKNNLRRTARILGISRTTLYNKMAKFKLPRKSA